MSPISHQNFNILEQNFGEADLHGTKCNIQF